MLGILGLWSDEGVAKGGRKDGMMLGEGGGDGARGFEGKEDSATIVLLLKLG